MEFLLIFVVAGIIFWALTSAAKARAASNDGRGCCGGGCHGDSDSRSDGGSRD